jgi:threonine dehydrogenase-like Zn-dependent dehydrogenase
MFDGKLEMAKRVGATDVVNSSNDDPVKAIRALTGGAGVDHAFEAVGNAKLCARPSRAWRSAARPRSWACCRPTP